MIKDASKLALRKKHGTQIQAKAKEGTVFYHRMAAWPVAFEETAGPSSGPDEKDINNSLKKED